MAKFSNVIAAAIQMWAVICLAGCSGTIGGEPTSTASIAHGTTLPPTSATGQKAQDAKIALILPLSATGEAGDIARAMKQAAELALFEADNPNVHLVVKDDRGTPDGAAAASQAAVADGAEIILGPLFGKSVMAAAPIARKVGVSVVSFSNDPSVAGNGVYLMSYLAAEEVNRVVAFAASKGKKRFAALIPSTPYGQTVEPAFRKAVAGAGGEIVTLEHFGADTSGMLDAAKRVVGVMSQADKTGNPVDALFVPAGPEAIAQLSPLLTYSGIDTHKVKLLGTSAWDMPVLARDDQLIGGWYAASDASGFQLFSQKYAKSFANAPPRLATLAYDAMTAALALAKGSKEGRFSAANLTRANGFAGVDGPLRLQSNGLVERGLAVFEIEKYRSVVVDAAPQPGSDKLSTASAFAKFF